MIIGLRAKAIAMPVEKCSDGAANAAAAMFIHGTWWPSVNSMPEKPAASVRRARSATWSQVVARVMTSNSMVFSRWEECGVLCRSVKPPVVFIRAK